MYGRGRAARETGPAAGLPSAAGHPVDSSRAGCSLPTSDRLVCGGPRSDEAVPWRHRMQAWQVHENGEPSEVMRLGDTPVPTPGDGQVLLKVRAANINFPDALM